MDPKPACTRTVTPDENLKEIVEGLPEGAVVCLAEGRYKASLFLEKSITLRGVAGAVLRGAGASVLQVAREVSVDVEGLTLQRGSGGGGGEGGNVSVNKGRVTLRDCILEEGEAEHNGGGGLQARRGRVLLERCILRGNNGSRASAVLVDRGAEVTLRDCLVVENQKSGSGGGPALHATGGGTLVLEHTTVVKNEGSGLIADGEATVRVIDSVVEVIQLDGAQLSVKGSALSEALPASALDLGDNRVGPLELDTEYRRSDGRGARR